MQRQAFTLVELSIVLVIIGLLVGGVLSGQSLIHAAELRSVSSDFTKYQGALNAFRDKYFALPGDMTNATAFWGKDNTNCAGNTGAAATPGTCNGNGDGLIYSAYSEEYRAWQQLALAGLIEGSYTGIWGGGVVRGVNAPASKMANGAYGLIAATSTAYGLVGTEAAGNKITFGTGAGDVARNPIVTPADAWNLDTKMDDGLPGSGSMVMDFVSQALCSTGTTTLTYNLSDPNHDCSLRLNF